MKFIYFFLNFVAVTITFQVFFAVPAQAQIGGEPISLVNPIGGSEANPGGQTDINKIVGNIIRVGLGILGSVTFVVFMYGGFLWLSSRGNSDMVREGLDVMLYAAIGIFIIFASYAILTTILSGLK